MTFTDVLAMISIITLAMTFTDVLAMTSIITLAMTFYIDSLCGCFKGLIPETGNRLIPAIIIIKVFKV